MRNILRAGVAVFALLVATNVASAQGGGGGGRRGGGRGMASGQMMADRLLNNITLDDAQKEKLTPVVAWYDSASAAMPRMSQDSDSTERANAMQARQKLNQDFQAKIKAILTPEQQKTFDTNAAQRGGGRRGGRG